MYNPEKSTLSACRGFCLVGDVTSGMFEHWGLNLPLLLSGDWECQLRRGGLGTKEVPHCAEIKRRLKNCRKPLLYTSI